ncbi:outer membrane protein assembly factor BamB [Paraburkholderia sp. GAS448]|uniref:outer membrane protein assembly factor BamB family protein n=1 Tax=Paraburkholderia sp. GAS448 TaxID=3035136 RepID=UPI003D1C3260
MARISGILYVTSGSLFADNVDFGTIRASAIDLGLVASPVPVGDLDEPYHRVYTGASDGTIYRFGPPLDSGGAPVSPLPDPVIFSVGEEMTGSLAHADGVLFVGTGTDWTPAGQGSMFALDDATGDVRWVRPMGGSVQFPASIAFQNDQPYRLIVGTMIAPSIQALNPTTGEQIWSQEDYPLTGHTVHGDIVYYADLNTTSLRARSVVDGSLVWENVNIDNFNFNRPVVARNVVYATSLESKIYAFDAIGGNILWEASSPSPGVPVICHDYDNKRDLVIFAAGEYSVGNVFMVALDGSSGAPVWTSNSLNTGPGARVTDPILCGWDSVAVGTEDGRLIFLDRMTGEVGQIQLSSAAILSSPKFVWL